MVSIDADASLSGLKTGDLVLFTGQGLARGLARWFNRSPWTHVGLVLRGPDRCRAPAVGGAVRRAAPGHDRGARSPCAWPDRAAGSARAVSTGRSPPPRASASRHCGRRWPSAPAPRGLFDLIGAADDGWVGARRDNLGEPMDGELVAEAYQRIGLLDDIARGGKAPGAYRPWHFCAQPWPRAEERLCPRPRTGPARCRPRGRLAWDQPATRLSMAAPARRRHVSDVEGRQWGLRWRHRRRRRHQPWSGYCWPAARRAAWAAATSACGSLARRPSSSTWSRARVRR